MQIIQAYGGSVDSALNRCTHLLCESQVSSMYLQVSTPACPNKGAIRSYLNYKGFLLFYFAWLRQALREGKRCVTAHWLNTVLKKKRMVPPHRTLHLPFSFPPGAKPCSQHVRITLPCFFSLSAYCIVIVFNLFLLCSSDYFSHWVCGQRSRGPEAHGLLSWSSLHRIPVSQQHRSHLQRVNL